VVDALSKWEEVDTMRITTSASIIQRLRAWFSRYGVPAEVVTDNGPQFVSLEIEQFFKKHSTNHIKTTPYHPRSNGLVERLIRTLKRRYRSTQHEINDSLLALQNVLFSYRNAPQKTTGRAPAEMFFGRRIPSILDNIKPNLRKHMEFKLWKEQMKNYNMKPRCFTEGEEVWAKNERNDGWTAGTIKEKKGPYSYEVISAGVTKRKHADHLRKRTGAFDQGNAV